MQPIIKRLAILSGTKWHCRSCVEALNKLPATYALKQSHEDYEYHAAHPANLHSAGAGEPYKIGNRWEVDASPWQENVIRQIEQ